MFTYICNICILYQKSETMTYSTRSVDAPMEYWAHTSIYSIVCIYIYMYIHGKTEYTYTCPMGACADGVPMLRLLPVLYCTADVMCEPTRQFHYSSF